MTFNKGYKKAFVLIVYEINFHSRHEKHFQTDPLTRDWNSSTSQPNPWRLLEIAFLFGCPPALRTKGTKSLELRNVVTNGGGEPQAHDGSTWKKKALGNELKEWNAAKVELLL
ncbi:hypothetical protein CEXT_41281 [Caerostris extrusa]|uniref:Uncharacterized protein n=1 Tax=Caerostris extrusa TaxID=172846 RepID=A0AAV4TZN1_CAEEX|nr:hypothetical protein CEXT_41281 [Caerostris extrusa]